MAQEKIKILNIKIKYRVSGATSAGRKKVKQRQNNNGRGGIRRRKFVRGEEELQIQTIKLVDKCIFFNSITHGFSCEGSVSIYVMFFDLLIRII